MPVYNNMIISADALIANYHILSSYGNVIPVIKGNAYGLGLAPIGRILSSLEPPYLCVAYVEEAITLRAEGISTPLLVLYPSCGDCEAAALYDLTFLVDTLPLCEALHTEGKKKKAPLPFHLYIDTGLHRGGIPIRDIPLYQAALNRYSSIRMTGMMSHFLGQGDPSFVQLCHDQVTLFQNALQRFPTPPYLHMATSATLAFHTPPWNAIRIGAGLWGLGHPTLLPVLTFQTFLFRILRVEAGASLGYRQQYTNHGNAHLVGMLPLGYYHGLSSSYLNKGYFYVKGIRANILSIFMDCCLIDLSKVNAVEGDPVILFGNDAYGTYSLEDLARSLGENTREMLIKLGASCSITYAQKDGVTKEMPLTSFSYVPESVV